jgi:hypothetical protein
MTPSAGCFAPATKKGEPDQQILAAPQPWSKDLTVPAPSGMTNIGASNGLLRQYFPKGTDLSRWSRDEIEAIAGALNARPRKTLGWKTPAEALNEQLLLLQQGGVATTP